MKLKLQSLWFIMIIIITPLAYGQTECHYFADNNDHNESADTLSTSNPGLAGFDSQKLADVDRQINHDIRHGFPGAALLIIQNGKVVKQTVYGYKLKYDRITLKKLIKPEQINCQTLFDLASNTKMYATNYALMHLVYQGKLDVDKPVACYLPEYSGCDNHGECRDTRTIRDLLTHRAGYMPDPQFFNPLRIKNYGENLYSQQRELTESIIEHQLPFISKRGGRPNYSDVDFMLLGMVVEKISGTTLDEYVANNIYHPLGLTHILFNPLNHDISVDECAATEINGNTRSGTVTFPNIRTKPIECQVHDEKAYYSMGGVSGHAGLFSNLADLAVLEQLTLNNGSYNHVTLWDKSIQSLFITPLSIDDSYALGWRLSGTGHKYQPFGHYTSNLAFGHTGWTGTLTLIDPEYDLAIVLLTNKKHTLYRNNKFKGDDFATGKYYPIVDLIYQALILPASNKPK